MIPSLTSADKKNMSLGQINRYKKKYNKLRNNNKYYISHYGHDVQLHDWTIQVDDDKFIYAEGYLGNNAPWATSGIVSMKTAGDHYICTTENNTVYRLYF